MRILIIGAGTIGLTYSWMLSECHNVSVLVKSERLLQYKSGHSFKIHDLRSKTVKQFDYTPHYVTAIDHDFDAILVMVNRTQLLQVLPSLQNHSNIIFMLNHWNIEQEVSQYLSSEQYLYGFPSQVGGGRDGNHIEAVVFKEGTILGEKDNRVTPRLTALEQGFMQAGLPVDIKPNILNWLKVHYIQQSLSAGAILKAGNYFDFANDYYAIKEMVYAFREGVDVCKSQGVNTDKIFPANMFRYPAFLVAWAMKGMFNKPETIKMVIGHMKKGMSEWICGFYEILQDGKKCGVEMTVWESYEPYVDRYCIKYLNKQ